MFLDNLFNKKRESEVSEDMEGSGSEGNIKMEYKSIPLTIEMRRRQYEEEQFGRLEQGSKERSYKFL